MDKKELVTKWLTFHHLEKRISSELEDILKQGSHPMSLNEFYSLYYLNETEGNILRMSDLSGKMCLSLSATSRLLTKFEKTCGVIERFSSDRDKREVRVKLTVEGTKRLQEAIDKIAAVMGKYESLM